MSENKTENKPEAAKAPALDFSLLGICPDNEHNRKVLKEQWETKYKNKISLSDYYKARFGIK